MWTLAHRNLQKACIYLFSKEEDARTLVSDSEIDASQIDFGEPPAYRWQSIITEAEKQNTMSKLIPVLLARYPDNEQLKAACLPFEAAEPVQAIPVNSQKQKTTVPAGAVLAKKFEPEPKPKTKLVPIQVPEELAEIVTEETVATVATLRITVAELYGYVEELRRWRVIVSTMSGTPKSPDEE